MLFFTAFSKHQRKTKIQECIPFASYIVTVSHCKHNRKKNYEQLIDHLNLHGSTKKLTNEFKLYSNSFSTKYSFHFKLNFFF
jgi:hypothetical protein